MNVFLVGEVSSGKSSFLNALTGGIVSRVSMLRETIDTKIYEFDDSDSNAMTYFDQNITTLEKKHFETLCDETNPQSVVNHNDQRIVFKSPYNLGKFSIYDFPGLNDSVDESDVFFELFKSQIDICDCLVYVTKAETAFLTKSELDLFNKIIDQCANQYNQRGKHIQICIIVNKFDNVNDTDLNSITNLIETKIPGYNIFRVSSHRLLLENIIAHKLSVPVPQFLHQEVKKIFQNANAIMTKDQRNSIINNCRIDYRHIIFNEEIDELNEETLAHFGDWDNFIDFLKREIIELPTNQLESRIKWLNLYLNDMANLKTKKIKQCVTFAAIVDQFVDILDIFISIIVNFLVDNIKNRHILCMSIIIYLFEPKLAIDDEYKMKLMDVIENELYQSIRDKRLKSKYLHLFFYGLRHSPKYPIRYELLLACLSNTKIWTKCWTNYFDIANNCVYSLSNKEHPKFKTEYVNKIMMHRHFTFANQDIFRNDIHRLIKLAVMEPKHLIMLDNTERMPYDLIKKYLDDIGCLRTKFYIRNAVEERVPYLFNNNPEYMINIEIAEYLEIETDLFTDTDTN